MELFDYLKAIVTIKRLCGLDWHQFFLTNKHRNTLTRATNSPRVSFRVAFENLLSAGIWPFVCIEYLSCLCCVQAVSVEYKYKHLTFFQLACTSRMFVLHLFFVFVLSKQDGYGAKVVFFSSRFEIPSRGKSNSRRYSTQNTKYGVSDLS